MTSQDVPFPEEVWECVHNCGPDLGPFVFVLLPLMALLVIGVAIAIQLMRESKRNDVG